MNQADTMHELREHILEYETIFAALWVNARQFADGVTRWLEGDVGEWLGCEPSELNFLIADRLASPTASRAILLTCQNAAPCRYGWTNCKFWSPASAFARSARPSCGSSSPKFSL